MVSKVKGLLAGINPQVAFVAVLALGLVALSGDASFATPATPTYSTWATNVKTEFLDILAQGGPAVMTLLGIAAGIRWVFAKLRSVAH